MKEQLRFVRPDASLRDAFVDMMNDWRDHADGRYEPIRERIEKDFAGQVAEWLALVERTGDTPETWPQHIFWLVRGEGGARRILGTITVRPRLPEERQRRFGHIGYEVRPSERRKGYATRMLSMALEEARRLGMDYARLACTKGHPSARVIEKNEGTLEAEWLGRTTPLTYQTWRIELRGSR